MISLCEGPHCRIDRLRRQEARTGREIWRRCVMADVVYLVVGILLFVVMGIYAVACDRL